MIAPTARDWPTTDEGAQEMGPRQGATASELLRELGAVLRMSEAEAAAPATTSRPTPRTRP